MTDPRWAGGCPHCRVHRRRSFVENSRGTPVPTEWRATLRNVDNQIAMPPIVSVGTTRCRASVATSVLVKAQTPPRSSLPQSSARSAASRVMLDGEAVVGRSTARCRRHPRERQLRRLALVSEMRSVSERGEPPNLRAQILTKIAASLSFNDEKPARMYFVPMRRRRSPTYAGLLRCDARRRLRVWLSRGQSSVSFKKRDGPVVGLPRRSAAVVNVRRSFARVVAT